MEVVVSEYDGNCISVFSREGKKVRKFGSKGSSKGQFNYPHGVAITTDNYTSLLLTVTITGFKCSLWRESL